MAETVIDAFAELLDGPVYVVTVAAEGERAGCLVGFASQCSIRPPRFMVWLSKLNHTYEVARRADHLAVHVLGEDQRALAERFGGETGDRVDKFADLDWRPAADGSPLLAAAPAWFTGRITARVDGGDHVGHCLAPTEVSPPLRPAPALLSYSDTKDIDPGHPA
jgi:flavin reductase (DIM6/NTAB) family NADH-FMN oxidoreductase RutF